MELDVPLLHRWFRAYYASERIVPPTRFGRRDFGFMFFDRGFMLRHTAFTRASELSHFLVDRVPAHAYHSTAYYKEPAAATMAEKGWLGADLIFDLDADHLDGAESMSYEEMLAQIKVEFIKLVDVFLIGDLGFDTDDVHIVFSGGRGYHAHISHPKVQSLDSHERREVVDYVTGNGLDMEWAFPAQTSMAKEFRDRTVVYRTRSIPPTSAGGWRGRMRQGLEELVEEMENSAPEELRQALPALEGTSDRVIQAMRRDLFSTTKGVRGTDLLLEKGNLEALSRQNYQDLLLKVLEENIAPRFKGEVDEPVTSDVKRLIRLPYSLHGKTGLRVTPLTRDQLDDFEPLRDAIPGAFTDEPLRVMSEGRVEASIRGERFVVDGEGELPTYAAVFMAAKRMVSTAMVR